MARVTLLSVINPARWLADCFGHFCGGTSPLSLNFFNRIAVAAQYLKSIHPSLRFKAFVKSCSAAGATAAASQFFAMRRAIVIYMVKAKGVNIGIKAAISACHRVAAVMGDCGNLKLISIFGLGLIVPFSIVLDPRLIQGVVSLLDAGFFFIATVIFAALFCGWLRHYYLAYSILTDHCTKRGQA
jgi:hypothetical protein